MASIGRDGFTFRSRTPLLKGRVLLRGMLTKFYCEDARFSRVVCGLFAIRKAIAALADEKHTHVMRLSVCHTFVDGRSKRPDSTLCVMRSTRTLHALANRIKELRDEKI
jgi:hypothetical protein